MTDTAIKSFTDGQPSSFQIIESSRLFVSARRTEQAERALYRWSTSCVRPTGSANTCRSPSPSARSVRAQLTAAERLPHKATDRFVSWAACIFSRVNSRTPDRTSYYGRGTIHLSCGLSYAFMTRLANITVITRTRIFMP